MNRIRDYYLSIAVKSPLLILAIWAVTIATLILAAKGLDFYEYTTQEARCQGDVVYTEPNEDICRADEILFYTDKNMYVDQLKIDYVKNEDGRMAIVIKNSDEISRGNRSASGYIEIPAKRISFLERLASR